jgi:phenylalanyl-tRNA synthetase beta chain
MMAGKVAVVGLVATLQTNLKRKLARVRIFEVGRTFGRDVRAQPLRIGGLAFGASEPEQWGLDDRGVDLFDVKGDIEALAAPLATTTTAKTWPWLHPGRSAEVQIDGRAVGWLGELHPRLVRHFELPAAPSVFELDLAALTHAPVPVAHAVSRLPSIRRDMAILVNKNITVGEILRVLHDIKPPAVETIDVFDVYHGDELPNGMKSVAILVLMRDTERTLTDADGERVVADLLATLSARFGATLRSQVSR